MGGNAGIRSHPMHTCTLSTDRGLSWAEARRKIRLLPGRVASFRWRKNNLLFNNSIRFLTSSVGSSKKSPSHGAFINSMSIFPRTCPHRKCPLSDIDRLRGFSLSILTSIFVYLGHLMFFSAGWKKIGKLLHDDTMASCWRIFSVHFFGESCNLVNECSGMYTHFSLSHFPLYFRKEIKSFEDRTKTFTGISVLCFFST